VSTCTERSNICDSKLLDPLPSLTLTKEWQTDIATHGECVAITTELHVGSVERARFGKIVPPS
jgi:hypothetical protein